MNRSKVTMVRSCRAAVVVALILTAVDWLGWATGVLSLTRLVTGGPPMTPWSAVMVTGLGIAILLQSGVTRPARVNAGRILAATTGALALVFIAEYLADKSFGLDQVFFREAVAVVQPDFPGRPSPQTASSVALLAGALVLLRFQRQWAAPVRLPILALAAVIPSAAIMGNLFNLASVASISASTGMSTLTSGAMTLLIVAAALARPDDPPASWLAARRDHEILLWVVGTFAVLPVGVAASRLVIRALGARGDAAWGLSLILVGIAAGFVLLTVGHRFQLRMADALTQSRTRAEALESTQETVIDSTMNLVSLLTENTVDVVVHLRDGKFVWVSPSIEDAFGWPISWWLGNDMTRTTYPDDLEVVAAGIAEIGEAGAAVARFRVLTADGGYHWVEGHGKPFIDAEGNPNGLIVALRVIDDQVALEKELQEARDHADVMSQAMADYVVTVSHEIRAPLNAILGFSELLDNQLSSEGRSLTAEWSRLIRTEAERLTRLIEDLQDLSRLEAGQAKVASRPFALRRILDGVIQISRVTAAEKGLELNGSVDPSLSDWRSGDPDKLQQVMVNLVSNAVKFTREGRIDVEIAPATTDVAADLVRFAVTDTGPGIPADQVEKILEPFAQVSATDATRGSGLGLAISDRIVKTLGGDGLAIASLEGHGSTFHFTIPLPGAAPQDPSPNPARNVADETGSGLTILVADDNPTNQLLIEAQLEKLGYGCVITSNGAEALEQLEARRFAAVLMDCNMPVMDGYAATRNIRAGERSTGVHTPVIALTASATVANREACKRAGMDGFLTKPLLLTALSEQLTRTLGRVDGHGCGLDAGSGPEPGANRSAPETPVAPILDDARIDRLLEELGPGPLQKVALTFVNEIPRRLADLHRVAEAADVEAVRRSAHVLRSPSAMLGAVALAERLRAVEEATDPVASLSEAPLDDLVETTLRLLHTKIFPCANQEGTR